MRQTSQYLLLPLALACVAPAFGSEQTMPPEQCTTLSPQHEAVRFGSQYLIVGDGDARYRLEFSESSCFALQSASIVISTDDQAGRLCGSRTIVKSKSGRCDVRRVDLIEDSDYQRYKRIARNR